MFASTFPTRYSLVVFALLSCFMHVSVVSDTDVEEGLTIALIGDSTVCEYPLDSAMRGWGQMLPGFLLSDAVVVNCARVVLAVNS
jgi:lysophospholipase L1-like esterase